MNEKCTDCIWPARWSGNIFVWYEHDERMPAEGSRRENEDDSCDYLQRIRSLECLAGALTTAVLQSSSATTVMVIGFVSAGLMSLPQAISIILGANIGTTMTAQIIAFKIELTIFIIDYICWLYYLLCCKNRKSKEYWTDYFCIWSIVPGN